MIPAAQFIVEQVARRLYREPDKARSVLDRVLSAGSAWELCCAYYDWDFWLREKQIPPMGRWRSYGYLSGRAFGKTFANACFIQREVMAGRATRIALIAQSEERTIKTLIEGESGLIATSPPWFRARYEKLRVIWPNGAQAFVYTPEVPNGLRGPEHDLAWASEIASWPTAHQREAWHNLDLTLRIGQERVVWDSTPRRRHPIIKELLQRAIDSPTRHIVVRGSTTENVSLDAHTIAEWYGRYGGTQHGREELEGEFFDESDGALWKSEWIEASRRDTPVDLTRRIISVDPAISTKRGTDRTGIVEIGLGVDEQVYVLEDLTDKHAWPAWGKLVVARYFEFACDCVVVERNRGGDACFENLRACAKENGYVVQKLDPDARTRHDPRVIYVKETMASRSKEERHYPVATMYERGLVSHVNEANLDSLEDWLTTWEPSPTAKSPDAIDALVQGVAEVARFSDRSPDHRRGFDGIGRMARELAKPVTTEQATGSIALVEELGMGRSGWGEGF